MLPPIAAGEAMFSYALSEREAGSDAASMRTRAVRDGDDWVLNGTKCWITNAGVSELVHGDGGDRPGQGRQRHLGVRGAQGRPRLRRSARRSASSASRARRPRRSYFENCRIPGDRIIGDAGHRLQHRAGDPGPHPAHDRRPGASASPRAPSTPPSATSRSASSSASRSSDFQGVQFMLADMAMQRRRRPPALFYAAAARRSAARSPT